MAGRRLLKHARAGARIFAVGIAAHSVPHTVGGMLVEVSASGECLSWGGQDWAAQAGEALLNPSRDGSLAAAALSEHRSGGVREIQRSIDQRAGPSLPGDGDLHAHDTQRKKTRQRRR
jgi:hypothetical protein